MLRKVSSAPRDLKFVVRLLELFNRESLVFKSWCALLTKHQKYHRIYWKKFFIIYNFIVISAKNPCFQRGSCASSLYVWYLWKDHSKSTSHNFQFHWITWQWDFVQHIIFSLCVKKNMKIVPSVVKTIKNNFLEKPISY